MEYLFVYGTLRTIEGHPMHNYLRGHSDFLGAASVMGTVENLGEYTGLMPSGNPDERVEGELYRIHEGDSDKLFEVLDRYEGCHPEDPEPHDYFRHRLDTTLSDTREVFDAWVYLYNG